jgi:hypothetical protein
MRRALTMPNATNSFTALSAMAIFKGTIIVDRPFDRVVQVTLIYPEGMNVTNVQELAEKAYVISMRQAKRTASERAELGGKTR